MNAVDGLRPGINYTEVRLPDLLTVSGLCDVVSAYESAREYQSYLSHELVGHPVRQRIEYGLTISDKEYEQALNDAASLKATVLAIIARVDALVLPTVPFTAPRRTDCDDHLRTQFGLLTRPFSLFDLAAITVPIALVDGLSVGVQIVARDEANALIVGDRAEHLSGSPPFAGPVRSLERTPNSCQSAHSDILDEEN